MKVHENAKLKLEKQILQNRIEYENDMKLMEFQHQKQIKLKLKEIEDMEIRMKERDELNETKIEGMRERLKRVEKNVYEKVEQEYSEIIEDKDKQLVNMSNTVFDLE